VGELAFHLGPGRPVVGQPGIALAVGIAAAVVLFGLHLLYQQQRAASLVLQPPAQASSA
jgi:hypothetical protein